LKGPPPREKVLNQKKEDTFGKRQERRTSSSAARESVVVRKEHGVAWIRINRPEVLNALDTDVLGKLHAAMNEAEEDPLTKCVVLTGEGRAFSAGADIRSLRKRQRLAEVSFMEHLRTKTNPLISKMRHMDKPIIAMINGVAAGAGMSLALAADIKIMAEDARFVEAFAKIGLAPDAGATFLMTRSFGASKAMELALTGDEIDAKNAERLGAVNAVVPRNQLERDTRALAERLAKGPMGIRLAKRAMNRALVADLDAALDYEAHLQEIVAASEDFKEGVDAFYEKRAAKFQGK
jgi:2-(1,2-epoxy-1,2-dihydrophenyl)acetyl-CoA isomerase